MKGWQQHVWTVEEPWLKRALWHPRAWVKPARGEVAFHVIAATCTFAYAGGQYVSVPRIDYGYLGLPLITLVLAMLRLRSSAGTARIGWAGVTSMLALWSFGDLWYQVSGDSIRFPGIADWAYFAGYLTFIPALILLLSTPLVGWVRRGYWFDWLAVVIVASVITVRFLLPDRADYGPTSAYVTAIAYPLLDLAVLASALAALLSAPASHFKAMLIASSIAILAGDFLYYGSAIHDWQTDLFWLVGYWLLGLAILSRPEDARAISVPETKESTRFLPYAGLMPLILAFLVIGAERPVQYIVLALSAALVPVLAVSYLSLVLRLREHLNERQFAAALLDSQSRMGEGLMLLDDLRPVHANSAAAEILGRGAIEILGAASVREFFPAGESFEQAIHAAGDDTAAGPTVLRATAAGGGIKDLDLAVQDIWVGTRHFRLLLFRDVTWREQARRDLERVQKFEVLGEVAGGVAHDFNNLLAAILMGTDLLATSANLTEADQEIVDAIRGAAMRGTEISQGMLSMAQGGLRAFTALDAAQLIRETVRMSRNGLQGVEVEVSVPEETVMVRGDRGQLTQCLLNLLVNARDAAAGSATVRVTLACVAGEARIGVRDNGTGIPAASQARLFEPFFTTKAAGTGLGLSTCYRIMLNHGGSLAFTTAEGEGSEFVMSLPLAAADTAGQ